MAADNVCYVFVIVYTTVWQTAITWRFKDCKTAA